MGKAPEPVKAPVVAASSKAPTPVSGSAKKGASIAPSTVPPPEKTTPVPPVASRTQKSKALSPRASSFARAAGQKAPAKNVIPASGAAGLPTAASPAKATSAAPVRPERPPAPSVVPAAVLETLWAGEVSGGAPARPARRALPTLPPTLFANDPPKKVVLPTTKVVEVVPAITPATAVKAAPERQSSNDTPPLSRTEARPNSAPNGSAKADVPTDSPKVPPVPNVRLWLVARDSFTLVAYWNPPAGQLRELSADWGAGVWQLRLWLESVDRSREPEVTLELNSQPAATHRFLPVLHAGQRYVAELGHWAGQGHWRTIARSEPLATPADHGGSGAEAPEFRVLAATAPGPTAVTAGRSTAGPLPVGAKGVPVKADARSRSAAEQRTRIVAEEFLRQTPGSSADVVKVQRAVVEGLSTFSQEEGGAAVAGEGTAGESDRLPSSEELVAVGPVPPRGFWFEVNAELIVHGRTERGATVTLGGRPVKLRADGSFTFRFALPDGDFSLPAVAVSAAQDDQRSAALRFVRQTTYQGAVGTHPIAPELQPPVPEAVPRSAVSS